MVMDVNPVQPSKALSPILDTELGIEIDVSPVQPEKAEFAMLVTLKKPL